jgi:hypothetical protein
MANYLSAIFGQEQRPSSIIQNPFRLNNIRSIHMNASDWWNRGKFEFSGTVKFQSGDTSAEQTFKADSFPELYMKIQKFCESL